MTSPTDWLSMTGDDLRLVSDGLVRIARLLHEHTRRLEVAVEGKYANDSADPRVRLLSDSLQISRRADLELGRIHQAMQRTLRTVQGQVKAPEPSNGNGRSGTNGNFEREREALTTSISNLQQERKELETLSVIARTLNSTLEFDQVLSLVMDQVIRFVNAERGFLMLVNPATGEPEFTTARDKQARVLSEHAFTASESAVAKMHQISRRTVKRVIDTRRPLLTDDAQIDDALKGQESIMAYGIRSIMCAPLIVRNNCIGAVYVDSRVNANLFDARHLELLLAFCNQAAIAIDNARLFADLNKAVRQVTEDKQYMDNIFESIANGVITTNSAGIVTTFNAAASAILMLKPEQVTGKHYEEAFKSLPQVGLVEVLRNAKAEHMHGTIVPHVVDCAIPERGSVDLNFYVSSLRDTQGAHIGMALVIDDRTELKRSRERAKEIRRIFERYVHPNVVQQLIQDPMALNLGGEIREISVVSADIRGYTRLSEGMPAGKVVEMLNTYFDLMVKELWSEGGMVTAFWGDELMAIFNAPLPQKTHALHAVRAAWKMRVAIQEYQRSLPREMHVSFGFGVNTGLATVGNIGARERMQSYTAIGDVVNVASRLQSNTSDNLILLNEATYIQVYRHVQVDGPRMLEVKNKSAPLTVYRLLGVN
ncbi:MAG TPA: adenylate/guanylate cyclase domain-containing protein [Ktedonobacteraceae bacterium]|nr:adenylate/guanylate cyclase domain-containing protein [Ktedonobacteraceae bacterium]